ncbi:hypothetical protein IZY60_06250 [Lutibacter sp. B2]|nr:hypothetical protein [Lutibacter sp. B2]
MERGNIHITGEHIKELLPILIKKGECTSNYKADNVIVLMSEVYYTRIKSNLLSMYIVNIINDSEVQIELVTGGGKDGLDVSWGAEKAENIKKVNMITDICNENSWKIVKISPEEFEIDIEKYNAKTFLNSIKNMFR